MSELELPKGSPRPLSRREDAEAVLRKLRENDPVIEVLGKDNPSLVTTVREGKPNPKEPKDADHIELVSMTIKPGEEMIVGQRLRAVLAAAWKKAA